MYLPLCMHPSLCHMKGSDRAKTKKNLAIFCAHMVDYHRPGQFLTVTCMAIAYIDKNVHACMQLQVLQKFT